MSDENLSGHNVGLSPTIEAYGALHDAYDYYNAALFEDRLPNCLITLQRRAGLRYGHFCSERFAATSGETTDEISINPKHIIHRPVEEVLATLVHEMTHLEQFHFGKPSRSGYHNKEWGSLMKRVGLYPSHIGAPGGKETGQQMTHYVIPGGRFANITRALLGDGFTLPWGDALKGEQQKKPVGVRAKFICSSCGDAAWGKPDLSIRCEKCSLLMLRVARAA